ncbi:MAG TPA: hypothetical protein ENN64_00435 [bacterium]|nr:hypothetical protein [bacterium]
MEDISKNTSPTSRSVNARSNGHTSVSRNIVPDNDVMKEVSQSHDSITNTDPTNPKVDPLITDKILPEDLDSKWLRWRCTNCGFLYEGVRPLRKCPKCGNTDPDKFEDAD